MPPPTCRNESRTPTTVAVELSILDEPFTVENTSTENISPHGARVVTKRRWHPNERVFVKALGGDLGSRARVVYCEALQKNAFAIGLERFSQVDSWINTPLTSGQ